MTQQKYGKILDKSVHEISYKTKDENWTKPIPNHGVPKIKFKLDSDDAMIPHAKREGDIGFDVYASRDQVLPAGKVTLLHTDVILADCPKKFRGDSIYLKVEGRSGLAIKGIFPVGGIIDPTYRGEIGIITCNSTDEDYEVHKGDRIAQLIVYRVVTSGEMEFVETNEVVESNRGAAGYGSSGR